MSPAPGDNGVGPGPASADAATDDPAGSDAALDDAWIAAALFAVDPAGTGLLIRGGPGSIRVDLLEELRALLDGNEDRAAPQADRDAAFGSAFSAAARAAAGTSVASAAQGSAVSSAGSRVDSSSESSRESSAGTSRNAAANSMSAGRARSAFRGEPWLRMPLSIADDRLLGGLDLTATLARGSPVVARGLLAEADGRVLLIPMIERLSAERTGRLCAVLDSGEVHLAREGVEQRVPSRFGLIGLDEGLDADEACPAALLDRLAFQVRTDPLRSSLIGASARPRFAADEISAARALLPMIDVAPERIDALCATAAALGISSLRAVSMAVRAARCAAALSGNDSVDDDDLALAARLVLAPRATRVPAPPPEDDPDARADQADEGQDPPPEDPQAEDDQSQAPDPETEDGSGQDDPADDDRGEDDEQALLDDATEILVAATAAAIPEDVLAGLESALAVRTPGSAQGGRSGAQIRGGSRGRPVGVRVGAPRTGERLALVETLRAAAPWQPLRAAAPGNARIRVEADDFRVVRYQQRTPTVTIFVVDASGSAAVQRLAETKGAVERLLADCYVRRDEVAVIAFRGTAADVLLPPTRSLVRARRSLSTLPGGGGTPLAAGVIAAHRMAVDCRRRGATPIVVLLTDGRGNVDLDGVGDRRRAGEQTLTAARALLRDGTRSVVIDTSARPDPSARALADALGGAYRPLPFADAAKVSRAVAEVQQAAQS